MFHIVAAFLLFFGFAKVHFLEIFIFETVAPDHSVPSKSRLDIETIGITIEGTAKRMTCF